MSSPKITPEFIYNNSLNSCPVNTPFCDIYGFTPPLPGLVQNICELSSWPNLWRSSGCSGTLTGHLLAPQGMLQYEAIAIQCQIAGRWFGRETWLSYRHTPHPSLPESQGFFTLTECMAPSAFHAQAVPPYVLPHLGIQQLSSITHSKDSPQQSLIRNDSVIYSPQIND